MKKQTTNKTKTKATRSKQGFGVLDPVKERKVANKAIAALRGLAKRVGYDLSIHECHSNRLRYELGLIEDTLNELLPPPGSTSGATLPDDLWSVEETVTE
jgi:hypothetical protein